MDWVFKNSRESVKSVAKSFDLKMNSTDFNAYKTRYRSAIRHVLADSEKGRLDEAGFPA